MRPAIELLCRIEAARSEGGAELSRTLVHGDFVGYNVLLGDGMVLAVLDFDRLSVRRRVSEVAYTLLYVLSRLVKTGGRPSSGARSLSSVDIREIAHLLALYEARSGWTLTATEVRALPFEMAFAPFFPIVVDAEASPLAAGDILAAATDLPLCLWLGANAGMLSDALGAR
jgi:aminoglycoside phosphotransferase (APT) family kinase protein